MLTQTEKHGCQDILSKLTTDDVCALAETITRRQINISNRNEAEAAILSYTEKAVDFLRRKRVKRDVLFNYLAANQVVVPVTTDKRALIRTILQRWGSGYAELADMEINPSEEDISTQTSGSGTTGKTSHGAQTDGQTPHIPGIHTASSSDTYTMIHGHSSSDTAMVSTNVQQFPPASNALNPHAQTSQTVTDPSHNPELQALGEKFVGWFYEILNSYNPTMNCVPKDFGPHHFWDDCALTIYSHTPHPNEERLDGALLASQRLLSFTRDESLLFNPNISRDGVFVQSSPHGLVRILTCGTIHRGNDCLGIFQQVFGIINDPRFDSNWKIKISKLDVKSTQETAMPKLEGNVDSILNALVPVN